MMRQTEQQWKDLQSKVKVPDPVLDNQEAERKRELNLKIMLDVGTIQDKQAGERWMDPKPVLAKKKPAGIISKLLGMITGYILAWWKSPHTQQGAFGGGGSTSRPRKRKSSSRQPAPIRLKKMQWKDPEFEQPDFEDSFGGNPFGNGPRF